MDWHKNGRVEATNPRSQGKREGRKGEVSTPGDGKRSKEPKPMEAKTEQTKKNEPPKVRDVTLNRTDRCLGVLTWLYFAIRSNLFPRN
jgi:hypothetical protein